MVFFDTENPDFGGDPITFGLVQILGETDVLDTEIHFDYDNLTIGVQTATAAVPEPGTLPGLLTGLGLMFGLVRLRRHRW